MEMEQTIDRGLVLVLIAMGISTVVLASDFSVMNVALPEIQRSFYASLGLIEWVINAYALVFGILFGILIEIETAGRLADMPGRRRIFFIATAIFASMSFMGGIAQTDYWLIGARVLMGIGGAMMWPSILGITFAALAGGIILGTTRLGHAIGPSWGGKLNF